MFIDNLALTQAMLAFAAAVLAYMGVTTWWAMRKNNVAGVHSALQGGAVPLGAVGTGATILGLWSEMVWPYPSTMGGYNILFNDISLLFGLVLIAFALSAYLKLKLQYVGIFAFMAGAATILYGWTGYGYAYTKEPFDFLLLYLGFGVSGMAALPATVIVDYYLGTVSQSETAWRSTTPTSVGLRSLGVRGVLRLGRAKSAAASSEGGILRYRMPVVLNFILLAFPVFMILAGIAAWWFLGTTVPGHLTPGKTP